ncbi:MAG: hypothetical protein ACRD1V_02040 [Vicinamibacterales bacterium]
MADEQVYQSSSVIRAMQQLGVIVPIQQQFPLTGSENLRLRVASSLAGVVVTVTGRWLQSDGTIAPFTETFTPTSDRAVNTFDFALGEGALLNVVVFASTGTPKRGQCFAQLSVIQGLSGATILLGTLIQGYVTSFQVLAWPGSPISNSFEGQGWQHSIATVGPGAGNPIIMTVPAGARWEVRSLGVTLHTSSAAGSRFPLLEIKQGGAIVAEIPVQTVPGATWQMDVTFSQGSTFTEWTNAAGSPTHALISTSYPTGLRLTGGDQIIVNVSGMDAADSFDGPVLAVEEWLELD